MLLSCIDFIKSLQNIYKYLETSWYTRLNKVKSYILKQLQKRLVKLTESRLPKIGLNMTETDEPYLFEYDRKVTTTNVNLLNSTEKD